MGPGLIGRCRLLSSKTFPTMRLRVSRARIAQLVEQLICKILHLAGETRTSGGG